MPNVGQDRPAPDHQSAYECCTSTRRIFPEILIVRFKFRTGLQLRLRINHPPNNSKALQTDLCCSMYHHCTAFMSSTLGALDSQNSLDSQRPTMAFTCSVRSAMDYQLTRPFTSSWKCSYKRIKLRHFVLEAYHQKQMWAVLRARNWLEARRDWSRAGVTSSRWKTTATTRVRRRRLHDVPES